MRHVDHLAGDIDVVVVAGDGLAVFFERTVHHHRRKSEIDRALADHRRLAMVLMHHDRHLGIGLDRGSDQMAQEMLTGVFAGTGRGLHDHRRIDLSRGRHDGLDLLEIVDVEGRNAIGIFGGMIEKLAHRDERHGRLLNEIGADYASARIRTDRQTSRAPHAAHADRRQP